MSARGPLLALAAVLALSGGAACSSGPGFDAQPGDVLLDDSPAGADEIRFYFDEGASDDDVSDRVVDAVVRAGVDPRDPGVTTGDEGLVRVTVDVTIGERTGALERTVRAEVLAALAQEGRLLLRVPRLAELERDPVETSPFGSTYQIAPGETRYRFPPGRLLGAALPLLAVLVLPYPIVRTYVRRLRRARLDAVDKVHRLHRALVLFGAVAPILVLAVAFSGGASVLPEVLVGELAPRARVAGGIVTPLFLVLILGAALLPASFAAAPYVRELRDIDQSQPETRRRATRGVAVMFAAPLTWILATRAIGAFVPSGFAQIAAGIAFFLVFLTLVPLLLPLALGRGEIDETLRGELLEFVRSQGVRVRDVRVVQGRAEKHGNAFLSGIFPFARFIFVTDYLVDRMSPDEVKAIVAHEIGHAKKHHLLIKLGVPLLLGALMMTAVILLHEIDVLPEHIADVTVPGILVVILVATILLSGALSTRFEHAADDYAAGAVGVGTTVRGLEKLAEINMAKRTTGRLFNILTQHPSIEARVERLRSRGRSPLGPTLPA